MTKKIFTIILSIITTLCFAVSCKQKEDTSYLKIQLSEIQQQHVDVIYNNLSTFIPNDNSTNEKRIMLADYSGNIIINVRFYYGTFPSNPAAYSFLGYKDVYYLITADGYQKTTVKAVGTNSDGNYIIGDNNISCKKTHKDVYFSTDIKSLTREDIENVYKKMLAN